MVISIRTAPAACSAAVGAFLVLTAVQIVRAYPSMRALRKCQAGVFALRGAIVGEARIVERAFGAGPCVPSVAMAWLQDPPASAQA